MKSAGNRHARTPKQRAHIRQQALTFRIPPRRSATGPTESWWLAGDFYARAKQEAERMTQVSTNYDRREKVQEG